METQRAADLAWLLAPTPSLSQLSFIFNDLIQFKSFRNTARFMFAIYNRETIIKKLILKTNKNRTTGPGPPTGQFSELCLSINVLTPGRGFVTIILNICDDNSNQMSGYWEGRGCSPGVLPPRVIALSPSIIRKFTGADLLNWWVTTQGSGHIAPRISLCHSNLINDVCQRFFVIQPSSVP